MDPSSSYHPPTPPEAPQSPVPPSDPNPSGQFNGNQFDFIMNPQQAPKKSLLPTGSPKQRLIIIIVGILVVLVVVILLASTLLGGSSASTDKVVLLAEQQNEIIRVAAIGNTKAGGTAAKKLAALTSSTMTTDQANTIAYLSKQGKKVKSKELTRTQNKKTDAELAAAEQNGRFDEVFVRTLLQDLKDYQTSMKSTYASLGKNGQELLNANNNNVTLILSDNKN